MALISTRALCVFIPLALLTAIPVRAQSTVRVSVRADGTQAPSAFSSAISPDGRFVAFSAEDGLIVGQTAGAYDVIVHDRWTCANVIASVPNGGGQSDFGGYNPVLSADGRRVAFMTNSTNLVPEPNVAGNMIVVRDIANGVTMLASVDVTGTSGPNSDCVHPEISRDGRFVIWDSGATDLVPGDTNGFGDVFLRDLQLGVTERISVSTSGVQGDDGSGVAEISGDGRYVSFGSGATNLVPGDTNGRADFFLRDRNAGTTTRLTPSGASQINGHCGEGAMSSDARFVAIICSATNLVPGNTSLHRDLFRLDRTSGIFLRINVNSSNVEANDDCFIPAISDDGRFVAWWSRASNLVPGDANGHSDIFVRDCVAGTTTRASVSSSGADGTGMGFGYFNGAMNPSMSADGKLIAFTADFQNLVAGDTNGYSDVFVRDQFSVCAPIEAYCSAKTNSLGCKPAVSSTGEPHVAGAEDGFFLSVSTVRSHKKGTFTWSTMAASTPFGGGTLCIGNPMVRTPSQDSGGQSAAQDCRGNYSFHFGQAYLAAHAIGAGLTLYGQFWSRDNGFAPPNGIGLSDGIRFTTCP